MKPSNELKSLFQELVNITTKETGRRDWAIIRWKSLAPFTQFKLVDLIK